MQLNWRIKQMGRENKMSVEMLQTVSLICFGIAGLFLLIAVALFFILDVPALMGEATGATERTAIASIR